MKAGWQTKKLGELCEIELGKTPARANNSFWDERRETGNVWLSIADLLKAEDNFVVDSKEYVSDKGAAICKLVPQGTLLVSFKLTLGRLAFAGRDLFTNEAIAALSIFNERELSKEFLFYFLHFFDWVKAAENDVKLKGMTLNKAKLKEMLVYFPSPSEQQRIVGILDAAFDGIATAKANAEQNLQNARALFESHLQSVFTQRGEEWVEKPLSAVCDLQNGYAFKSGDYIESSSTLNIRMSSIRPGGSFDSEHNQRFLPDSYAKEYASFLLKEGDLIIAMTDMAGDPKILGVPTLVSNLNGRNFLMNQRVGKLFGFSDNVRVPYLRYFLASPLIKGYYKSKGAGGLQINISKGDILSAQIPIPGIAKQDRIVDQLDELSEETQRLESLYQRKLAALDELKKSLLHRAFNGQLTIDN